MPRATAAAATTATATAATEHTMYVEPSYFNQINQVNQQDPSLAGIRVNLPIRQLLERMNFKEALVALFGMDFMDTLQIEQMQDRPNYSMFVVQDEVEELMGMLQQNARLQIKNVAKSMVGEFKSFTIIPTGHANLSLVIFCTTSSNFMY